MRLIDANMFEVVTTKIPDGMDAESYMAGMDFILNKIDNAPTIEPERKKGEWKFIDDDIFAGYYICPECGERAAGDPRGKEDLTNYCPNCGTDLRGGRK